MFTPEQYRAKALEYGELAKTSIGPDQLREFQDLEKSFTVLADNEQWLADNCQHTVCVPEPDPPTATPRPRSPVLAEEEGRVLRCLGAAVIMQWDTLPAKLQRELFDNAGSMGELLETAALREEITRFLHKHKDWELRTKA
jgi:hypothetical protein